MLAHHRHFFFLLRLLNAYIQTYAHQYIRKDRQKNTRIRTHRLGVNIIKPKQKCVF